MPTHRPTSVGRFIAPLVLTPLALLPVMLPSLAASGRAEPTAPITPAPAAPTSPANTPEPKPQPKPDAQPDALFPTRFTTTLTHPLPQDADHPARVLTITSTLSGPAAPDRTPPPASEKPGLKDLPAKPEAKPADKPDAKPSLTTPPPR